jgi:hypothetical protein
MRGFGHVDDHGARLGGRRRAALIESGAVLPGRERRQTRRISSFGVSLPIQF